MVVVKKISYNINLKNVKNSVINGNNENTGLLSSPRKQALNTNNNVVIQNTNNNSINNLKKRKQASLIKEEEELNDFADELLDEMLA